MTEPLTASRARYSVMMANYPLSTRGARAWLMARRGPNLVQSVALAEVFP